MPGWLIALGKWLLGRLFGGNADPKLTANAAVAEERQAATERENDALKAAAADRAAGDAERLRNDPHAGEIHADRNDAINQNPDLHLRD